jgi:hypothetical protein
MEQMHSRLMVNGCIQAGLFEMGEGSGVILLLLSPVNSGSGRWLEEWLRC